MVIKNRKEGRSPFPDVSKRPPLERKILSLMFMTRLFTHQLPAFKMKKKIVYALFFRKIIDILRHMIWVLQEISHMGNKEHTRVLWLPRVQGNITQQNRAIDGLLECVT